MDMDCRMSSCLRSIKRMFHISACLTNARCQSTIYTTNRRIVTITVRTPALCLLDTSDKSFLYAYHIRHSPYARFVRTTSLPYLYHSLSVTFVLHMVPSLS